MNMTWRKRLKRVRENKSSLVVNARGCGGYFTDYSTSWGTVRVWTNMQMFIESKGPTPVADSATERKMK